MPLVERKAELQRLLPAKSVGPIRYVEDFDGDGRVIFEHAKKLNLEGIISKLRDAPYRSGRSDNFVKTKAHDEQEFVIAGFSPSAAMPRAIGALTVAYHDGGELRYAGRVGTGYSRDTARDLWQRLEKLRTERPPLAVPKTERRKDVIWVKPDVVVEAEYRGITHDGLLRQAAYKGLREDKAAREVVRERPAAAAAASRGQAVRRSAGAATVTDRPAAARAPKNDTVAGVRLTHPDRVYWPDDGVTKKQLAEYYASVWDWIKPQNSRPRAVAGAGAGGNHRRNVFPETYRRQRQRLTAAPLRAGQGSRRHRRGKPRRSDRAGAVRRARNSRARLAARQPGDLRPYRVRSRSGRGRDLEGHRRRGARDARPAQRLESSRAS